MSKSTRDDIYAGVDILSTGLGIDAVLNELRRAEGRPLLTPDYWFWAAQIKDSAVAVITHGKPIEHRGEDDAP
jgi:hypothetical protein